MYLLVGQVEEVPGATAGEDRAPAHLRGTAVATFTGPWEVSALLLRPLFGFVADRLDDASMFALLACLAAVALAGWTSLEHRWGGSGRRLAPAAKLAPGEG